MPDQLQLCIRKSGHALLQLWCFKLEIMSSPQRVILASPPHSLGIVYSLMEGSEAQKIEIRSLMAVVLILAELTSQLSVKLIAIPLIKSPVMASLLIPQTYSTV